MERLHLPREDVRDLPDWWVQRAEIFWSVRNAIEEAAQKAAQSKSQPRKGAGKGSSPRRPRRKGR